MLLGIFLVAVDSSVVAVAMPSIVNSLQGVEIYSWAFTAYILTSTVSGPLWGRISDVYGRRLAYMFGLGFFMLGSLLCGAAPNMLQLILFRAVQGLGGGALLIITFTLVGELFSLRERAKATGYTSSAWALAGIIGPPMGGFLVDNIGWRWIFLINIPAGAACMLIVFKNIREAVKSDVKIDVWGAVLFMIAATSLLLYLNGFEDANISTLFLLFSAAAFILFIYNEQKSSSPLIPLNLFKERLLSTGFLGNFLAGFIFFGVIAYMPPYLQWVLGFSATASGTLLLPLLLAWVVASNVCARIVIKSTIKVPVLISGAALVSGTFFLTLLNLGLPFLLTGFALIGIGMGFTVSTFLIATQTLVPREMLGVATSLLSFLRLIGGAIAATVMYIPISATLKSVENLGDPILLTAAEKAKLTTALTLSMSMAAVAAIGAFMLYVLAPNLRLSAIADRKQR